MPSANSTTATFLFTDIEGSTRLLRSNRADYAGILTDHHRLLREQFAVFGGTEIDNQGDSFFVAFTRAKDAVLAAAGCQRALAQHTWPGGADVRVRMGIHTGEADVASDRYVGLSVHRAARICAVGHGGQVLVSATTAGLLEDEDDLPGVALKELGEHRLKDISRPVRLFQLEVDALPTAFPPLSTGEPDPSRRRRAMFMAVGLLAVCAAVIVAAIVRHGGVPTPPKVLPNSVVRINPTTLKPVEVVPVGDAPDLVIASGGYVWVTHHVLRDTRSAGLHNAGDRTLTRINPATGMATTVGGGLAPCGLAADPSGDVWVADCFASGSGPNANVVRVAAGTLTFRQTLQVPGVQGFYRGLAYGGGSLWVSDAGGGPTLQSNDGVWQVDPQTRALRLVSVGRQAGALAWADGYGDLWVNNFDQGSVTRLDAATGAVQLVDAVASSPSFPIVAGNTVWLGDWDIPEVVRLRAMGSPSPQHIRLPAHNQAAGVWSVAEGGGYVWATTPRDHALWRIDVKTDAVTRVPMPYLPTCVTATADEVWVTVRKS